MRDRAVRLSALNSWLREEVAQRERAQASLSQILRAWTATLDAIEDPISVHDWDFRILRANRALGRAFGCKPAELIGQKCYRLFHDAEVPNPDCPHLAARETGATATREVREPRAGRSRLVTCSPYCDERGRAVGTVHVVRDVSEQRQRDRERETLIDHLREALARARVLGGLLPICASCKKIRDDRGYWNQIEIYLREHSDADFTHGICPQCAEELYPPRSGRKGC